MFAVLWALWLLWLTDTEPSVVHPWFDLGGV